MVTKLFTITLEFYYGDCTTDLARLNPAWDDCFNTAHELAIKNKCGVYFRWGRNNNLVYVTESDNSVDVYNTWFPKNKNHLTK